MSEDFLSLDSEGDDGGDDVPGERRKVARMSDEIDAWTGDVHEGDCRAVSAPGSCST